LLKQPLQADFILADVGIDLAIRTFEIRIAHHRRAAMPGAGDVNHVEVVLLDDPVQVHVNEVLPGGRAPVSQQHMLHIAERQRPLQQGIVVEVDLPDRKIVRGPPVGIHPMEEFRGDVALGLGRMRRTVIDF
jgi:hypothetical protein